MMNTILIICSVVLAIIAGLVTWYAVKQEDRKIEKHKEESPEEARKRSLEYEENSVSSVLPVQIWAYSIVTVVTIVIVVIFAINI